MSRLVVKKQFPEFPIHRRWLTLNTDAASSSSSLPSSSSSFTFTVLSYNILAQCLIRRDFFPFASKQTLRVNHRKQQLMSEMITLKPDIITMQECDRELFNNEYSIQLQYHGYEGIWDGKQIDYDKGHGCAVFYQKNKFTRVSHQVLQYQQVAEEYMREQDRDAETGQMSESEASVFSELNRGNIAQVLVLQCCSPSFLNTGIILTNTHLFWEPHYRFVRLRQVHKLLQTVSSVHAQYGYAYHPILTGDWNITPNTSIYAYLTQKRTFSQQTMMPLYLTPAKHGVVITKEEKNNIQGSMPTDEQVSIQQADNIDYEDQTVKIRTAAVQRIIAEVGNTHIRWSSITLAIPQSTPH